MNGRIARKIRKVFKKAAVKDGQQYVAELSKYPFRAKLRFCYYILTQKGVVKGGSDGGI